MSTVALLIPHTSRRVRHRRLTETLCIVLAIAMYCTAIGRKDIVASHEARVAQTARQMAASGWPWRVIPVTIPASHLNQTEAGKRLEPDPSLPPISVNPWLVPVMNGAIRLQKPPLPYWCAATAYRMAGIDWSAGAARLVPAVGGAACTWLVIDLAALLLGSRAAPIAGLVWIGGYFCFDEFRKAMADPYLAVFSLLSAWAWIRATVVDRASPSCRTRSTAWLILAYVAFALASLAKFPVNLLHVALLLIPYHICFRRRLPGPWLGHVLGAAIFLAVCLPWPIYILTHVPHALELWRYESVGEFADNTEKARGPWFYPVNVLQIALPWTAIFAVAFIATLRRKSRRRFVAWAWFVAEIVVFSFSNVKKNAYLLPVVPAIVLIITQGLQLMLASRRLHRLRGMTRWLIGIQLFAGVAFAVITVALMWSVWKPAGKGHAITAALLGAIVLVPLALLPQVIVARLGMRAWVIAQACVYAVIITAMYQAGIYPSENLDHSARPTANRIAQLVQSHADKFDAGRMAEEASVYLPLNPSGDANAPATLAIADDRRGEAKPASAFSAIPPGATIRQVDTHDLPGHERWKLYELTQPAQP